MARRPESLEAVLAQLAREGELYEPLPESRVRCYACGHRCLILPGQRGVCKVRWNEGGRLMVPWGYVAGLQLDPVEKKPFFHAYPGARALSFGMLGCDYHCGYCFRGDTPVLTPTGAVSIQKIFDDTEPGAALPDGEVRFPRDVSAVTPSGRVAEVTKAFRHAYRGPMAVIKPMYFPAVHCTPDHRWLAATAADGPIGEVRARDLTTRHWLIVPKPLPTAGEGVMLTAVMAASAAGESSRQIGARLGRHPSYIRHVRSKIVRGRGTHFLVPVKAVTTEPFEGDVFNLEVAGEHAYVAGFCGVRNCQNALTSQALRDPAAGVPPQDVAPEQIVDVAIRERARILTSTYNEPLITSEWAVDVFRLAKARGLVCSYVSNGNATPEVLDYLRPWVDLYKVDLKSFDDRHYRKLGGLLTTVLDSIRRIHALGFWLEVVTLVIPGFNDSDAELRDIARFLTSVSLDIPWHVTAFHRDYKMTDRDDTTAATLVRAAEIGCAEGLRYVYAGNLPGRVGPFENTRCPGCHALLVERVGYRIVRDVLTRASGQCPHCATRVPGVWR